MRVAILGGAGDMGSQAVVDAARNEEISYVRVADFNLEKAQVLADACGKKVEAKFVDANSPASLQDALKDVDAVLSCIGPFYKYEARCASASLEAGVPYVSLCDDFDAAEEIFRLHEQAQSKNITLLTGCGWTPGLSNVLARKGIEQMDEAREVHIAWSGDADDSEGLAVIKHTYHIFTGQVKTVEDGVMKDIPAGSGKKMVDFLPPIGTVAAYHLGHPEPVTFPRFYPSLRAVTLRGVLTPTWLNPLAKVLVKMKLTSTPEKKDKIASITKKVMGMLKSTGGLKISGLRVDVGGLKDGKRTQHSFLVADKMKRLTGIPAAIALYFLAAKKITQAGVFAPEGCMPVEEFLLELQKRNIKIVEERKEMEG